MLDRYWFGDVSCISPEAPVPVVKVVRSEERPGGAANVARNARALGAQVALLALVGNDEPGERLRSMMQEGGIEARLHVDEAISNHGQTAGDRPSATVVTHRFRDDTFPRYAASHAF